MRGKRECEIDRNGRSAKLFDLRSIWHANKIHVSRKEGSEEIWEERGRAETRNMWRSLN